MNASLRGCLLALTTAFFWGTLPIALKQITEVVPPLTIVWLRFTVAAAWLWMWLPRPGKGHLPHDWSEGRLYLLFFAAIACLGGNFVLYNISVIYLSAPATQIIAQAGPLLLMLGGVTLLRERLCLAQGLGGLVLVAGLLLFFHDRLHELARPGEGYGLGIILGVTAAVGWALYGVAQKILLREYAPASTLRVIYTCMALALIPLAQPQGLVHLDAAQWACMGWCCLNTIVAYGCFSKAMSVWSTAGVGAILSLTPLFTLAGARLAHAVAPRFFPDAPLLPLSYFGALLVVAGAVAMAAAPQRGRPAHR